jgi:ferric-dicitrate binding protein FerR (iron transport regulator)
MFEWGNIHKMVTLARGLPGCIVFAAIALLYVECRDWADTDTRPRGKVESTAVGEMRHLLLDDGSGIDLNTRRQRFRVFDSHRFSS